MSTTVNATLKHKRGTEESMPVLKDGQIYLCSDTHKVYKGTSTGENILICDIASLNAMANDKADLANPNFTGIPTINNKNILVDDKTEGSNTILNGIVSYGNNKVIRKQNIVTINIILNILLSEDINVATVPLGFRPSNDIIFPIVVFATGKLSATCKIAPDGTIRLYKTSNTPTTTVDFHIVMTYMA